MQEFCLLETFVEVKILHELTIDDGRKTPNRSEIDKTYELSRDNHAERTLSSNNLQLQRCILSGN